MKQNHTRFAVITGASRGLGYATAEALAVQHSMTVFALARNISKQPQLKSLTEKVTQSGRGKIVPIECDVTSDSSVEQAVRAIKETTDRVHVLVNNAGVFLDHWSEQWPTEFSSAESSTSQKTGEKITSVEATDSSLFQKTIDVNVVGVFRVTRAIAPFLRHAQDGCLVNISSGMGQLSEMNGGFPAYRVSKTAINALTRILSEELAESNIRVNSVCPGWVRTDMGGEQADRTIEEGIAGILWAATLPKGGPTGGFFRDGERIDW